MTTATKTIRASDVDSYLGDIATDIRVIDQEYADKHTMRFWTPELLKNLEDLKDAVRDIVDALNKAATCPRCNESPTMAGEDLCNDCSILGRATTGGVA